MPLQEVVSSWDQQPQEWADVDWGSPLASGLVSLLVDGASGTRSLIGALSGGSDVAGASLTPTATAFGPAYRGASNLDWHAGPDLALANQTAITVIALVIRTGSGSQGFSGPFGIGDSSPTISLEANPDNYSGDGVFFSAWNSAGTRSNLFVASNAKLAPLNTPQVVAIRVANSTLAGFYDGRLLGSTAGPATLRTFGSLQKGRSQGIRFNGIVPFAACWNRGLSDAEIASISANPWQLFQRREWVPMAAGSGGGVTGASSGTLELSGTAAGSVLVSGASAGALAISGTAAAAVRVTGASTGTLSLSGTATGTVGATGVTGQSSQTLSFTGTSTATVRVSGQSAQTLTLSGTAAGSVRVTGASDGTLSLTGTATGNTTGAVTGASNGVLSLSGTSTGTVRVSGGSAAVLQITGNAGAQIVVRGVSAGVLTMTGSATAINGEVPAAVIRASLSSRTRIRTDGAGTRPAQRSTASRPRQ